MASLFIYSEMTPLPFTPLVEVGLRVMSIEFKNADSYAYLNISFLATANGHISWGNTSYAYENNTVVGM
jgi:hypothetical protein